MPTVKIDPLVKETIIDLASLGIHSGQTVQVKIVGDFRATSDAASKYFADAFQQSSLFYNGKQISTQFVVGSNLSATVVTFDPFLPDNSDPDGDYGVRLSAPLFSSRQDLVDFNALTPVQVSAVGAREFLYNSGSGNDLISLPNQDGYQLTSKRVWNPLQVFKAGDGSDTIRGGDGKDRIDGGNGSDKLFGGHGNDLITGGSGNDRLEGENGNDRINADAGNDRILGGWGRDVMAGGLGRDAFVFDDEDTGASRKTADYILDFNGALGDKLDLKQIDANSEIDGDQGFRFVGTHTFTDAGQVRNVKTATDTYVYLNTDSDTTAEAVVHLNGSISLTKAWFVL